MKICITAAGNTLGANTDPSFGRAPWLILVDTETLEFEAIENSGVNATQGAGIAAAQTISNQGAEALFTGQVGPKAREALGVSGISIHEGLPASSVKDAVELFKNETSKRQETNSTQQTSVSNAQCRPGQGRSFGRGMGMGRGGGRCRGGSGPGRRGGM